MSGLDHSSALDVLAFIDAVAKNDHEGIRVIFDAADPFVLLMDMASLVLGLTASFVDADPQPYLAELRASVLAENGRPAGGVA